jgi:hypothetical protein
MVVIVMILPPSNLMPKNSAPFLLPSTGRFSKGKGWRDAPQAGPQSPLTIFH